MELIGFQSLCSFFTLVPLLAEIDCWCDDFLCCCCCCKLTLALCHAVFATTGTRKRAPVKPKTSLGPSCLFSGAWLIRKWGQLTKSPTPARIGKLFSVSILKSLRIKLSKALVSNFFWYIYVILQFHTTMNYHLPSIVCVGISML